MNTTEFKDLASIKETHQRLKAEGWPVGESTLRHWVKTGVLPATMCGTKALIYWPNILGFIQKGTALTVG